MDILLGLVWSPCIGPTIGGAIGLAAAGESLVWATLIMLSFVLGVGTIIVGLAYGARNVLQKRQAMMRSLASKSRVILGIVFLIVGLMILFQFNHLIDKWAIQSAPIWLQNLWVRF